MPHGRGGVSGHTGSGGGRGGGSPASHSHPRRDHHRGRASLQQTSPDAAGTNEYFQMLPGTNLAMSRRGEIGSQCLYPPQLSDRQYQRHNHYSHDQYLHHQHYERLASPSSMPYDRVPRAATVFNIESGNTSLPSQAATNSGEPSFFLTGCHEYIHRTQVGSAPSQQMYAPPSVNSAREWNSGSGQGRPSSRRLPLSYAQERQGGIFYTGQREGGSRSSSRSSNMRYRDGQTNWAPAPVDVNDGNEHRRVPRMHDVSHRWIQQQQYPLSVPEAGFLCSTSPSGERSDNLLPNPWCSANSADPGTVFTPHGGSSSGSGSTCHYANQYYPSSSYITVAAPVGAAVPTNAEVTTSMAQACTKASVAIGEGGGWTPTGTRRAEREEQEQQQQPQVGKKEKSQMIAARLSSQGTHDSMAPSHEVAPLAPTPPELLPEQSQQSVQEAAASEDERPFSNFLPPKRLEHADRMTCCLDLDDTLVHTFEQRPWWWDPEKNPRHFEIEVEVPMHPSEYDGPVDNTSDVSDASGVHVVRAPPRGVGRLPNRERLYVCIRPHAMEFLEFCLANFEVVFFTTGTEEYARHIFDHLDPGHVAHRLYRHHCTFVGEDKYKKDLRLMGRPLDRVFLLDDRGPEVSFQEQNVLLCEPFILNSNEAYDRAVNDDELLGYMQLLEILAKLPSSVALNVIKDYQEKINEVMRAMEIPGNPPATDNEK
ncbi:Dullard-like phosphatase domain-containing protein [Trypanosoma grayi]|uniref:Dullard-like phosphatase domain-containing protein n=1 Tax=Trypanosoma grayi TaxID=71804 RepID=UPI0004F44586|nr:Dullard-like phosphatase domain-containing protein [Trypanosoma grayi]KEG08194.1 Dullard-like phosphatase domain-containing protein [Trypanosoma grayi]